MASAQRECPSERPKPAAAADSKLVKSARRVLEILEFLDDLQRESTVMEIVEALSYPQSSTSALLRSMVAMGYLVYDPFKRTYLTSSRVALMGSWINAPFFAEGGVISIMNAMQRVTGDTVVLGMRNGPNVQYIHALQSRLSERPRVIRGVALPLSRCAPGYAILATLPQEEAVRIAVRVNAQCSQSEPPVQLKELCQALATVRQDGYAFVADPAQQGGGMIAATLPPIPGQRQMVLGVGVSSETLKSREHELAAALLEQIDRKFRGADRNKVVMLRGPRGLSAAHKGF